MRKEGHGAVQVTQLPALLPGGGRAMGKERRGASTTAHAHAHCTMPSFKHNVDGQQCGAGAATAGHLRGMVGAVATGHRAPTAHRRELLPSGGSARMELEHAGLGLGIAHIEDEARGRKLGPDRTGVKTRDLRLGPGLARIGDDATGLGLGLGDETRGPELGPRPARTGDEAMDIGLGFGSARIGDKTRGLGLGPGLAHIGDKRRGLGLGFVLALLVLRMRRWALGAVRSSE